MDVVDTAVRWLVAHTYVVVFLGSLFDATGLPFPGRVLLVAAGAVAEGGGASLVAVIALGAAGAMVTDQFWYFAGRLGGERLLQTYCALSLSSGRCERTTTDYFRRFGILTILIGRYVAGVRLLAWPLAHRSGIRYPVFLAADLVGAVLWSATWALLGWYFAERWQIAAEHAGTVMVVALAAAIVLGGGVLALRLWRRRAFGPALPGAGRTAG